MHVRTNFSQPSILLTYGKPAEKAIGWFETPKNLLLLQANKARLLNCDTCGHAHHSSSFLLIDVGRSLTISRLLTIMRLTMHNKPEHSQLDSLTVESLEDRMMLSTVQIFAAGTTGSESLELKINDVVAETFENIGGDAASRNFQQLAFTTDQQITASEIRLEFINDLYRPEDGFDRNIVIDRIVVDGNTYQTESPSTFSTGVWRDGGVSGPGFLETETLNINGSFFYSNDGISDPPTQQGTILRIEARGTTGEEQLQLRVDGEVVETFNVSEELDSYFYTTDQNVSVEQVQLEFTNDLYDPAAGVDRNLVVQQIQLVDRATLERQRFFTTSDSTFSTGTWRSEDGVVDGFGRGDTLHANGYFRFGLGQSASQSLVIDPSYGDNGFAAFNSASFSSRMAVSRSGRMATIVSAGDVFQGTATTDIRLFDADGNFINQTTIGGGGRQQPRIFSLEFGPDESIFVNLDLPRSSLAQIVKLTPEGDLDQAFGINGRVFLDRVFPASLSATSDGNVLSGGRSTNFGEVTPMVIRKYDAAGNVIQSFGNNGTTELFFGTAVIGIEATSDDGAYFVVNDGQTGSRTVTRLTAAGQPDPSFGVSGSVFLPPQELGGGRDILVDSKDRLVLTSLLPSGQIELLRLTSEGFVDTSFGDAGTVTLNSDFSGFQFDFDPQDRVIGYSNVTTDAGVTAGIFRLDENGNLDLSFDDDGIFETAFGLTQNDINQRITNVRVDGNGSIFARSVTGVRKYDLA